MEFEGKIALVTGAGGKVIFIGSMAGKGITAMTGASYTAAKAGLLGFCRQMEWEVGPYGINCNVVCPAGIMSSFTPPPQEQLDAMLKRMPIRRITYSDDIANAVVFLASEASKTITGISIDVESGMTISMGDWDNYIKVRKDWIAENRP